MIHVVLLGDSIFDNASYVSGKPPVVEQLCSRLPAGWQATLLAVDGHLARGVVSQTSVLPADASHLIVGCGGNDALSYSHILNQPASSVADVLQRLSIIRSGFQKDYGKCSRTC